MIPTVVHQATVVFAVPWSIAAVVDTDGRQKFDQFFRRLLVGDVEDHPVPDCLAGVLDKPPTDTGLIYDYCWKVRTDSFVGFRGVSTGGSGRNLRPIWIGGKCEF